MKKYYIISVLIMTLFMSCGKDPVKPSVFTLQVTNVTDTTAICGGNITSTGGASITAKGVCWATTQNPTLEDNYVNVVASRTLEPYSDTYGCTLDGLKANTTYYVRAFATNEVGTDYGEEREFTTLESSDAGEEGNYINGYEYVDLGLPSGLKWAACNVGAADLYETGEYFAWGELKTKESFATTNSSTYGYPIADFSGDAEHDVATFAWGSTWRMPTEAEVLELKNNCVFEWVLIDNDTQGCFVTGPNGNQIYLPASGLALNESIDFPDQAAYWTSTHDTSNGDLGYATYLYIYNNNTVNRGWMSRYVGLLVRPVSD